MRRSAACQHSAHGRRLRCSARRVTLAPRVAHLDGVDGAKAEGKVCVAYGFLREPGSGDGGRQRGRGAGPGGREEPGRKGGRLPDVVYGDARERPRRAPRRAADL